MNRLSAMRNFRISTHSTMSTTTLPGYTEYESPLPTYTCLYPLPQEIPDEGTDAHTEHIFHLNKRLGAPSQGTLTLISHASNPNDIPLIYSGGILKGSVNCELKEPATIRRISVILRGVILMKTDDPMKYTFFEETLFACEPKAKLRGPLTWPFEAGIPMSVTERDQDGTARQYALPEFFYEANNSLQTVYEIVVHVKRGKFQSDLDLCTKCLFTRRFKPPPASLLRQAADLHDLPLPEPDADPEGWLALPIQCPGKSTRWGVDVMISGTLYLAQPLVYTRGSTISCLLKISNASRDFALLKSFRVQLRRRITFTDPASRGLIRQDMDSFETCLTDAKWYGSTGATQFMGELHVFKELPASSSHPLFLIDYFVVVMPTKTTTFVPLDTTKPLLVQNIDVATEFAAGPLPRCMTSVPPLAWLRIPNPFVNYNISRGFAIASGINAPEIHAAPKDGKEGYDYHVLKRRV